MEGGLLAIVEAGRLAWAGGSGNLVRSGTGGCTHGGGASEDEERLRSAVLFLLVIQLLWQYDSLCPNECVEMWNACEGSSQLCASGGWDACACCGACAPSRRLLTQCWNVACRVIMCCLVFFLHGDAACEERCRGGHRACARLVACVIRALVGLNRCAGRNSGGVCVLSMCRCLPCGDDVCWCWSCSCVLLRWCCWMCWRWSCPISQTLRCCWSGRPPGIVCA